MVEETDTDVVGVSIFPGVTGSGLSGAGSSQASSRTQTMHPAQRSSPAGPVPRAELGLLEARVTHSTMGAEGPARVRLSPGTATQEDLDFATRLARVASLRAVVATLPAWRCGRC